MGNADAQSRRGNKSDFYITPFPCVRALIDNIDLKGKSILDPCCGTGVIGKVLKEYEYTLTEYDIENGTDFFDETREFDVIISNPPYSIKDDFIFKALMIAKEIYFILPYNVGNYNQFHGRFMKFNLFIGKYLMTPKFFMTQEETENPKRGGISAYAWYKWVGINSKEKQSENGSFEKYINLNDYFKEDA